MKIPLGVALLILVFFSLLVLFASPSYAQTSTPAPSPTPANPFGGGVSGGGGASGSWIPIHTITVPMIDSGMVKMALVFMTVFTVIRVIVRMWDLIGF